MLLARSHVLVFRARNRDVGGPPWDSGSDPEPSRVANADSAHGRGAGGTGLVQVALENSVLIKARDKKMRFVPWLLCMFFTWTVVLRL